MSTTASLPKISVIMPVLNGEKTIRRAIQSVVDQSYPHLELIILDGKSTDTTLDIIESFKPYVTYLESSKDGNPTIAVNKGLTIASGDLIVTFMCDDFYEKGTFAAIAAAYQTNTDIDIFTCGGRLLTFDSNVQAYKIQSIHASENQLDLNFYNICFANSAICCRFIKKSLFDRIGDFISIIEDGRVSHANDKEFLLRAVIHGAKNYTIPFIGHNYVSHPGSFTFSGNRKMTAKLYVEHCYFVTKLTNQFSLSPEQTKILQHWYYHQSARLAFYRFMISDFHAALTIIKRDLPRHPIQWLTQFIFAPFDFILRRSSGKIKKIFSRNKYLHFDQPKT